MNKNITLSINKNLLDKARVLAAMKRTSVNDMVRGFLEREVRQEAAQATRAEIWGKIFETSDANARQRKSGNADLFDREEFYQEVMRERRLL